MNALLFIFMSHNLLFIANGGKVRNGEFSKWVVSLEGRIKRFQSAAIENFKNIGVPTNYTSDTPREYDFRLPHILHVEPNEQKMKIQTVKPTMWDYASMVMLNFLLGRNSEDAGLLKISRSYKKVQEQIPDSVPFPCKLEGGRSGARPSSVHKLRPGDIDIVVTVGDSLASGTLLIGSDYTQGLIENRGLSAFGGGQGTWREFLTLPNIMKLFNPNLYGYATGDQYNGEISSRAPRIMGYNLAVAGAITDDLPTMLKTAVAKMKRDPKVDFQRDWKMYTIFVGGMDMCADICNWKRPHEAINHVKYTLDRAMTFLMNNSPRTLVNFILPSNLLKYTKMTGLSAFCQFLRPSICPCIHSLTFKNVSGQMELLMDRFSQEEKALLKDSKYQQKEDFAIVIQPIFQNLTIPTVNTPRGLSTDFRYLSPDCFHVSQRGHSYLARELWNSLMSPTAEKKVNDNNILDLVCPTDELPYVPTQLNSGSY